MSPSRSYLTDVACAVSVSELLCSFTITHGDPINTSALKLNTSILMREK